MIEAVGGARCAECGRSWLSLLDNRDRWRRGETGIAHGDWALTDKQVAELEGEIDRIWATVSGV